MSENISTSNLSIPTLTPEYAARLNIRENSEFQTVWLALDKVYDPELPGLTIWDLGILQNVAQIDSGWLIEITLTYSGCPAVDVIKEDIVLALTDAGIKEPVTTNVVLSPAWSTDLMSPQARQQLKDLNIAPPEEDEANIKCPICNSEDTEVISEFGSTACKALYRCNECLEPFDYFKSF